MREFDRLIREEIERMMDEVRHEWRMEFNVYWYGSPYGPWLPGPELTGLKEIISE